MSNTVRSEESRESSTPLIATLVVIFTLLLTTRAWSGPKHPQAEPARLVAAEVATATENAPEVTDIDPGCGCAEGCFVAR